MPMDGLMRWPNWSWRALEPALRLSDTIMRPVMRFIQLVGLFAAAACGPAIPDEEPSGDTSPVPPPPPTAPSLAPAPWAAARLAESGVPGVYGSEWRKAENRESCALVAPAALGDGAGATARAANFSGGWAVAYDQPGLRSAFGIAGSGTTPDSTVYDAWPHKVQWADGSSVGYGPEGGTGPNHVGYLRVAGQQCLYNVWSRLGLAHLEYLIAQLRFVEPSPR